MYARTYQRSLTSDNNIYAWLQRVHGIRRGRKAAQHGALQPVAAAQARPFAHDRPPLCLLASQLPHVCSLSLLAPPLPNVCCCCRVPQPVVKTNGAAAGPGTYAKVATVAPSGRAPRARPAEPQHLRAAGACLNPAQGACTHGAAVGRRLGRDAGERGRAACIDLVDRAAQLDQLPPRPALDAVPPAGALRAPAHGPASPHSRAGWCFCARQSQASCWQGQTSDKASATGLNLCHMRIAINTTVLHRSKDTGSSLRSLATSMSHPLP